MSLEIVPASPADAPEIARICHDAFGALHDRHGVARDFPTVEDAARAMAALTGSPGFVGWTARLDGRLVGSNFLSVLDPVAGVGPITVDPAAQSRGVGRALMQRAIDHAREQGIEHVRLFQEAVNSGSLSLYTRLGFRWRDAAATLETPADAAPDPRVRPMTAEDLPDAHALSERIYGFTRRGEVAGALEQGMPAFVLERERRGGGEARIVGYRIAGIFGHGMAETDADAVRLVLGSGAKVEGPLRRLICPLSRDELYRRLLDAGCRTVKLLNYMSLEAWAEPRPGAWMPSIGC